MYSNKPKAIVDLPPEILELIFSYISFDEISHMRLVCKLFDKVCQVLLNNGFTKVSKYHGDYLRSVKSHLPRRESERRNHPLFRHSEILTAIETRISLLSMTFSKYVQMKMCCFIPGKVIDEIYRILHLIQANASPPRAHSILQELRDISSMAMEHFDEKIAPGLKSRNSINLFAVNTSSRLAQVFEEPLPSWGKRQRKDLSNFQVGLKLLNVTNLSMTKEIQELKTKMEEQIKKNQDQEKVIMEQTVRLTEQDRKLVEMNRKLEDTQRQYTHLLSLLCPSEGPASPKRPLESPTPSPCSKKSKSG